jgi:transposase
MKYCLVNGIKSVGWPLHSPDINPIENVWAMFKYRYGRSVWKRQRIPRNEQELIVLVWEALPWDRIYEYIDSTLKRTVTCIRRNEGSTQW